MELNWTTVILEMINFLVLVWILKHFLYRPVLGVIERRRSAIEATLLEARQRQDEADRLREQYENRLAEWQQDKQAAQEVLQHELQQKRSRAIEELRKTLDAEREKADAIEQRRQREFEEDRQRVALGLGARFAARLLQALSGPELDDRILELACGQLARLTGEPRAALRRAFTNGGSEILVECAHTISPDQRRKLEQALGELLGGPPSCRYAEQPQLIAGLRLSMGDWTLGANLNDELKGFAEQAHGLG